MQRLHLFLRQNILASFECFMCIDEYGTKRPGGHGYLWIYEYRIHSRHG